jgi:HEAT repeat protein
MAGSYLVPMELPHLDAALRDVGSETAEVRWVAALALAREDGERRAEAVDALAGLSADPVEEVRAQAIEGLAEQARSGQGVPVETLHEALTDDSDLVRMTALEAAELFADDPSSVARRMLDDPQPGVRVSAARLLADRGATDAAEQLAAVLRDADDVVRFEAALALARIGDDRGEQLVIAALDRDEPQAIEAVLALGALGSSRAVPALEEAGSGWLKSAELKALVGCALVRCGERAGLDTLARLLTAVRGSTRMAALRALARLPVVGIAPRIGEVLDRDRELEASSAMRALVAHREVDRAAALGELEARRGRFWGELAFELDDAVAAFGEGA